MKIQWILLVVVFVSGCDQIYGFLDKPGAEEKKLIGESIPFEKNPQIEEVQRLLSIYGYAPGSVDGALGAQTRKAIERFQTDNDLVVTRFVDAPTWEKLSVFYQTEFIKDKQLNIKYIQGLLKQLGYDSGKIDGQWGQKTIQVIKRFQKDHGLNPDGRVGYKTLTVMKKYLLSK